MIYVNRAHTVGILKMYDYFFNFVTSPIFFNDFY